MATGKTELLFSGQALSNAYVYGKKETLGYGVVSIVVDAYGSTSGVTYVVRGYPSLDAPAYSKIIKSDTAIVSGDVHYLVLSDPYEQIDVGVKSTGTNVSGRVTVVVTGKRRT